MRTSGGDGSSYIVRVSTMVFVTRDELKLKGKGNSGGSFGGSAVIQVARFSVPLATSLSTTYPAELLSLSFTYIHCVAQLLLTQWSEMCPNKLKDTGLHPEKMTVLFHQSCTILQGPYIPPTTFTSCNDLGSNQCPPDERVGTLTT